MSFDSVWIDYILGQSRGSSLGRRGPAQRVTRWAVAVASVISHKRDLRKYAFHAVSATLTSSRDSISLISLKRLSLVVASIRLTWHNRDIGCQPLRRCPLLITGFSFLTPANLLGRSLYNRLVDLTSAPPASIVDESSSATTSLCSQPRSGSNVHAIRVQIIAQSGPQQTVRIWRITSEQEHCINLAGSLSCLLPASRLSGGSHLASSPVASSLCHSVATLPEIS